MVTLLRPEISASLVLRPSLRHAMGNVLALVIFCDRFILLAVCLRPCRSNIACKIRE